jgi:predicted transcriptional regulator
MKRTQHVTPSGTAARIEKIRSLVTALTAGQLSRAEIADLLKMGQSGVRKYLVDLRGMVEQGYEGGQLMVRLVVSVETAQEFIAGLTIQKAARPSRPSDFSIAVRQPGRHFHILEDDEHYAIRIHRSPAARDPLVAALFGARGMEAHA